MKNLINTYDNFIVFIIFIIVLIFMLILLTESVLDDKNIKKELDDELKKLRNQKNTTTP
ncbi:hypothetical protein [Flavobacterium sp. SOK18b]|uniref:hypothetical protein n=1 Tax=Flavobacterium sp. SOK18b TaxID=797900 RepID=UPI0015F8E90A|nr:hypothetical protein [Flavobacterium sp. SOK18b]